MKKLLFCSICLFYQNLFAIDITLSCLDSDSNEIKIMFDNDFLERGAFISSEYYFGGEGGYSDFTARVEVNYLGDEYFFNKIGEIKVDDYKDPDDFLEMYKSKIKSKESDAEVSLKIDRKSLLIEGHIKSMKSGLIKSSCELQNERYQF